MADSNVLKAQKYLNAMFGGHPSWKKLDEDGYTGSGVMEGIIRAFQIQNGLTNITGTVGPITISTMKKLPIIEKMNPDDTSSVNVCLIQCALFCKGYNAGGITGVYYTTGVSAVREMQGDAGLQVTGKIDWKVWAGLLSMNWFKKVSGGDNITQLIQRQLNSDWSDIIGVGPCDGVVSRQTALSLVGALQAAEGVTTELITDLNSVNFGNATTAAFTITKYFGTYSEFLRKKTLLRENYVRQYVAQQKQIKKTEEFIRKNIAGRKAKMARGRQKQLDRMEKMEALDQKEIIPHFHFPVLSLTNTEHLLVKQLAVGYHYPVLSQIEFSIRGGQKVVITGFNGIGKSTLLKTLIGQIPSMHGTYQFSEQVKIGYFEQDLIWEDSEQTPIQIVANAHPDMVRKDIRKHLSRCGISSKHAMQPIGTLSGGEQAKVKMCLLTLVPCNFLILDEPTNHLDVQAKEALKTALSDFDGTVLLVSHEDAFYRDWAQRVINIEKR